MPQCKHAILIGSSEYPESDGQLAPLPCAATDVRELKSVLADPALSTFNDVQVALDLPHYEVMLRINKVMRKASREDQILLYYSGHGMLDGEAKLHLATVNTEPEHMQTTTIPADNLRSLFRETQCRRIVIVLDCCFAGAAGGQLQIDRFLEESFRDTSDAISKGYAVAVVTASAADKAAYAPDDGAPSFMTGIMIDAIRTGKADRNEDGVITIEEVFDYTYREMKAAGQSLPVLFHRGVISSLTIANSPLPVVWEEIVSRISRRIDEIMPVLAEGDGNAANLNILKRAKEILALPEDVVLRSYEALLSLLKDWSQDRLSFDQLMSQWYQFDQTDLAATNSEGRMPGLAEHWDIIRESRAAVMDLTTPAYLLDRNFHFLDWNPAFDEIVARHMGLIRFRHAEDFVLRLENDRDVIERSQRIFSEDKYPLVDVEDLVYVSPKYGRIDFKKIAAQIPNREGEVLAWSVNLNIVDAEDADALWRDIEARIGEEVNWSIYAKLYDRLLNSFRPYRELIEKMVTLLGDAQTVADLGAGTGNVLVELLEQKADRTILAVEGNEEMLEQLRAKFRNGMADQVHRVRLFKGDIIESLREVDENSFDGVMMVNVLYAMHNRARCLREIYRVLKPGGVVVYSTSTDQTDVDRLFKTIREEMKGQGQLHEMTPVIDLAYDRHQEMLGNILEDTEQAVVDYALRAGFHVCADDVLHREYAGAVTIVRATKPDYLHGEDLGGDAARVAVEPRVTVCEQTDSTAGPGRPPPEPEPQPDAPSAAPQLFISYAHEDRDWCKRILKYLHPAVDAGSIRVWADTHIGPGQAWSAEIDRNLAQSSLALLLVTPSFLVSSFIKETELPRLLTRWAGDELTIVPVLVQRGLLEHYACSYERPDGSPATQRLSDLQILMPGDKAVSELDTAQQNVFIDNLAKRILTLAGGA